MASVPIGRLMAVALVVDRVNSTSTGVAKGFPDSVYCHLRRGIWIPRKLRLLWAVAQMAQDALAKHLRIDRAKPLAAVGAGALPLVGRRLGVRHDWPPLRTGVGAGLSAAVICAFAACSITFSLRWVASRIASAWTSRPIRWASAWDSA